MRHVNSTQWIPRRFRGALLTDSDPYSDLHRRLLLNADLMRYPHPSSADVFIGDGPNELSNRPPIPHADDQELRELFRSAGCPGAGSASGEDERSPGHRLTTLGHRDAVLGFCVLQSLFVTGQTLRAKTYSCSRIS